MDTEVKHASAEVPVRTLARALMMVEPNGTHRARSRWPPVQVVPSCTSSSLATKLSWRTISSPHDPESPCSSPKVRVESVAIVVAFQSAGSGDRGLTVVRTDSTPKSEAALAFSVNFSTTFRPTMAKV